MKISLKWLAEMVEVPATKSLIEKLTFSGLEVEGVAAPGEAIAGVVVAEVVSREPHPNAEKLSVTQVATGPGAADRRQVVCGAKNFQVGDRVPLATPGTTLPGGKRIEAAELRGVASAGMLCSAQELGLPKGADGLLILPKDAPIGVPVSQALGLDDTVLELNVTPNRPDALSHLGVARELSVLGGKALRPPTPSVEESGAEARSLIEIKLDDAKGCPRFGARVVEGVKIGPSPAWLQARLESCGVRPINNVVDITNFVMLELGQPMHAYDLDRVRGARLVARRARTGEKLRTLDGKDRVLDADDLVIADGEAPQGIAGVMGGEASEVRDTTTRVLLEAASFEPATVRRSAKRHGLHSEASHRFERGVDPYGIPRALDRAASMLRELAGGEIRKGRVDVYRELPSGKVVGLRAQRLQDVLGAEIPAAEARRILVGLGFVPDVESPEQTLYTVPSFRPDVTREEDLIEEVARIFGYDRIPAKLPAGAGELAPESADAEAERRLRAVLSGAGFHEVVNYSFVSPHELEAVGETIEPIALTNPLSAEQSVFRTTLIPGLLSNVSRAIRHQATAARLYELGRAYLPDVQGGIDLHPPAKEPRRLAGILWGQRYGRTWTSPDATVDFFDAKGAVEALLAGIGISEGSAVFAPSRGGAFHPRACAVLELDGHAAGELGELHPKVAKAFDLPPGIFVFELELDALLAAARLRRDYRPLPKHPAVLRDLAVVVSMEVPHAQVRQAIREAGGEWVEEVTLFDQYTGKPIPAGKKNLAFALRYRAKDRTLTDTEVTEAHARIVTRVNDRFGAELRTS